MTLKVSTPMHNLPTNPTLSRRIIGIDPGSRITGYGIIDLSKRHCNYVASGSIRATTGTFFQRITAIHKAILQLIDTYQPTESAIEQVFVSKNASSALKLGHARGAAIIALMRHNLPVGEYAPRQIKQSIVGTGSAQKSQVQAMIIQHLSLSSTPAVDAADALAVALCHAFNSG